MKQDQLAQKVFRALAVFLVAKVKREEKEKRHTSDTTRRGKKARRAPMACRAGRGPWDRPAFPA